MENTPLSQPIPFPISHNINGKQPFDTWYVENLVGLTHIYNIYNNFKTNKSKDPLDWNEFIEFMYSKSF